MDGIEFGQVEFREPESELRPDRNLKFSVVGCGQVDQDQLPIFVDLDIMRDMEGHARTNTHVELGGVLLGGKYVDEDGRPFVVIKEALRAEHYEATRGSFKFTHETWAQITREREQFPDDLHLVGWYHTHPDWGVFLSGMDMFICDNFFSDDLDVDLVIDPCRGDRGWFFWDTRDGTRQKTRLAGFYLYTSRYRRSELLQFAGALANVDPAYFDPRYETPMGESSMQPVVNIHDQKSPVMMAAVLGMLTVQMLVLGLIAWRMLAPSTESNLAQDRRNDVYREIIAQIAGNSRDSPNLVERIEKLASANIEMQQDLEGRSLLVSDLQLQNRKLAKNVENKTEAVEAKQDIIIKKESTVSSLKKQLEQEKQANSDIKEGKSIGGYKWPIVTAIGIGTAILGLFGGTFIGRRIAENDYDQYDEPARTKPPTESPIPDMTIGEDNEQQ